MKRLLFASILAHVVASMPTQARLNRLRHWKRRSHYRSFFCRGRYRRPRGSIGELRPAAASQWAPRKAAARRLVGLVC